MMSLKRPTIASGCMNIILLYSNHRHVSATHVAIFRVVRRRIQIQLCVEGSPQLKARNFCFKNWRIEHIPKFFILFNISLTVHLVTNSH